MDLPEYESKELIAQYGVAIPEGRIVRQADQAEDVARSITAERYMVKAQIKAGGRGLAGGVKIAATPSAVHEEARRMIGSTLVTEQTGPLGQEVRAVYVEAAIDIADSYFIALALDPETALPTLFASASGGVEFEQMARVDPQIVKHLPLEGDGEALQKPVEDFLRGLGFPDATGAARIIAGMHRAFVRNDMTLLEVNPLAYTRAKTWMAIDAKVSVDDNAAFRHPELEALAQEPNLTPIERAAQESDINFVKLDGNVGVVVNGAGLALAINDMLVDAGGRPANFMDIRTTATSFDIAKGVELLLGDPKVDIVLLNIHGGGMTVCDTVAEGVAFAYARSDRKLPIVARLAGQNAEWGMRILKDRQLPAETCDDMRTAVARTVARLGGAA